MLFRSSDVIKKTCLIFDVGSDSVAGSWVVYQDGHRPTILTTTRVDLGVHADIDAEKLFFLVKNALREVLTVLIPLAPHGSPDKIFVFVAAPWYAAQIRKLHYAKRHPFIFTKRFADSLMQKDFETFKKQAHKEWRNVGDGHIELENKIMHTELNGYVYNDPIGKKAESVGITSFMSIMPQDFRDDIERIIQSSFHVDVEFHSALFASYFSLSYMNSVPPHYTIFDIRGETTDIAVVRNGYIQEIASLPFGDHTVVRNFAEIFLQKPIHMQELLTMYLSDQLDENNHLRIKSKLDMVMKKIKTTLFQGLSKIAERGLFPKDVYMYHHSTYQEWYTRALLDAQLIPLVSSRQKFSLHNVDNVVKGIVTDEEITLDPCIVAGAFFAQYHLSDK